MKRMAGWQRVSGFRQLHAESMAMHVGEPSDTNEAVLKHL